MSSRVPRRNKVGDNSSNEKLLNEVESISESLFGDKGSRRIAYLRSKSVRSTQVPDSRPMPRDSNKDSFEKDNRSMWSWKGLKALTHIRRRKFDCCFFLQAHSIEGLPPLFNDLSLVVHWKRLDGDLMTNPAKVFQGIAEFDEQLTHTCTVYASRNGPSHSAKYEAKQFSLFASACSRPELDLGKQWVDLTRLLPITIEELEDEKSSGKWTTSFGLSGKAKGASMKVSFGYLVLRNNIIGPGRNKVVPSTLNFKQNMAGTLKSVRESNHFDDGSTVKRTGSLPIMSSTVNASVSVEDVKDLCQVLTASKSELCDSAQTLYHKDVEKPHDSGAYKPELQVLYEDLGSLELNSYLSSVSGKEISHNRCDPSKFSIRGQEIQSSINEQLNLVGKDVWDSVDRKSDTREFNNVVETDLKRCTELHHAVIVVDDKLNDPLRGSCNPKENTTSATESSLMKKTNKIESISRTSESAPNILPNLTKKSVLHQRDDSETPNQGNSLEKEAVSPEKSHGLEEFADSVASEFLDILGIEQSPFGLSSESEPESPREKLLRQFENDSSEQGCSLLEFEIEGDDNQFKAEAPNEDEWGDFSRDYYHFSRMLAAESRHMFSTQGVRDDVETKDLMCEWGMDEDTFQDSPLNNASQFVIPVKLSLDKSSSLLEAGKGSFVKTKNGGFLRTGSPDLIRKTEIKRSLIMQVSCPVVLPVQMGSGIKEILQQLASVGTEKLSLMMQQLMPLEDIPVKLMEEIVMDVSPASIVYRKVLLQHGSAISQSTCSRQENVQRISCVSKSHEPESSSISNDRYSGFVCFEDLVPMVINKIELMLIDEMRRNSGPLDKDAHSNFNSGCGKFSDTYGNMDKICWPFGLEGALGMQLLKRQSNEDEINSMMALSLSIDEWMKLDSGEINNEHQMSEWTSKVLAAHHAAACSDLDSERSRWKREQERGFNGKCGLMGNNFTMALMFQLRDCLRSYEPFGNPALALIQVERAFISQKSEMEGRINRREDILEEEGTSLFKITQVHVAGLMTNPLTKPPGSTNKKLSGSRWLLANGMGKKAKHPFMRSKVISRSSSSSATSAFQPGDRMWSVSACIHCTGAKWKASAALNDHSKNSKVWSRRC